jgi:putative heme-binding domain-containing protein
VNSTQRSYSARPWTLALSLGIGLLASPLIAEGPLDRLTALAASTADPALRLDVLRGMEAALRGRNGVAAPAGWNDLETRLAGSADAETGRLARNLGTVFGSPRALEALRTIASDPKAPATDRTAALEALLRTRDPGLVPMLQRLTADPDVRGAALRGLAGFEDPNTPSVILGAFGRFTPAEQRDALNTLASRTAYARPLVEAVAAGQVPKTALTADLVRQLRSLKDGDLAAELTRIWGVMKETSPDMKAEVERVKRVYWAGGSQPGDAPRGRVVFNQVCAQCHHLFDTGGNVGPDITGANRADLDYLLQNILYPNAVIPNEYLASTVETRDERVLTGVIKSQDANTVTLQTANELVTLPRPEVRRIEPTAISMMPEGLVANLTDQQVRDLLYYLGRPGQVPLPAGAK